MQIQQLVLDNIRSYKNETINFPNSSVMLSGDIGSGKSSILQAIEFALFGIRRKSLSGNTLLRHGENTASVTLKLIIEEKEILIKRTLKRQKSEVKQIEGYIIIDGVKSDLTPVELKAKIIDLLNYPKDLLTKSKDIIYRYTVYTPQEEMKNILTEDSIYRLNTLRKVFDVDKYKLIIENSNLLLAKLKQECNVISGFISDLNEKKEQKNVLQTERNKLEEESKIYKQELFDLRKKIELENLSLKQVETDLKILINLKTDKKLIDENILYLKEGNKKLLDEKNIVVKQLNNLSDRKKNLILLDIPKIEKTEVEERIERDEALFLETNKLNAELRVKLKTCEEKIQLISKDVNTELKDTFSEEIISLNKELLSKEQLSKYLDEHLDSIGKLTESRHKHSYDIKNSTEISKISELSNCPTCLQIVSNEYKNIILEKESEKIKVAQFTLNKIKQDEIEINQKIVYLKNKMEDLNLKEKKLEVLKLKKIHYDDSLKNIQEKKNILDELNKSKEKISKELSDIKDIDSLRKNILVHKELFKKIQNNEFVLSEQKNIEELISYKDKRLNEIETENNNFIEKLKLLGDKELELNSKILSLSEVEKNHDVLLTKIKDLQTKSNQLETKITVYNSKFDSIDDNLIMLTREIFEKEFKKNQLYYFMQLQNWVDKYFCELMSAIEKQILLKAYYEFNAYFQKWFNLLMEEENMAVSLAEDFSVIVEQNGYETSFENLSGGEKTSCALAYRLALNKVINEINSSIKTKNLIILDEPTDGFSNEQLDKIRNVLEDIGITQVIIVSHENKIESFVEEVIRINKVNHISRVVF